MYGVDTFYWFIVISTATGTTFISRHVWSVATHVSKITGNRLSCICQHNMDLVEEALSVFIHNS